MKRKGLLAVILLLPLMVGFALVTNFAGESDKCTMMSMHDSMEQKADRKIPPYYENPDDVKEMPKVLDPDQFKDANTRKAYKFAQDNPRLLMQLPCGCGCDVSDGHKSLLSCYTDKHGEFCGTCQQEALMAVDLNAKGMSIKEIRAKIIEKFIY